MKHKIIPKLFLIFLILAFLITSGQACQCKKKKEEVRPRVDLLYWGIWDDKEMIEPLIADFQKIYPHIHIEYKKLEPQDYEAEVVNALAAGRGPDIWRIHLAWLPRHLDKIIPMPEGLTTPDIYKATFVDALSDLIIDGKIYGISLSVDSLALYYNKEMFNTAHIIPPLEEAWGWNEEFKKAVKNLTILDPAGKIKQAGLALGTPKNVNRAVDILYLLMLQNGTPMVNEEKTEATFDAWVNPPEGERYQPGLDALKFYTAFADSTNELYTWDIYMPYSIDCFIQHAAPYCAMMFNYAYQDAFIKQKFPRNLEYGIMPMPQLKDPETGKIFKEINFAHSWIEVVTKNSKHQMEAWYFLNFLASRQAIEKYCQLAKRPASRRDVIEIQKGDPFLAVFAKQALTAKNWYRPEPEKTESIFLEMINKVVLDEEEPKKALSKAKEQVSALMATFREKHKPQEEK